VDARRTPAGFRVAVDAGRTLTDREAVDWIRAGQDRGAGEVLLTSMDRDGGQAGFDLELLRAAAPVCRVPLIASGGFGRPAHAVEALAAGADAVLAASVFHDGVLAIRDLKEYLQNHGIEVRHVDPEH